MKTIQDFLEHVLDKKRAAEAHGMVLDVMVLHQEFYEPLMQALARDAKASESFQLVQDPKEDERKNIYLHGVRVMWSGDRLPRRQAWYRYSNPSFKRKA